METIELIHHRIEKKRGRRVVSTWTAAAVLIMGCVHAAPAVIHLINLPTDLDQPIPIARWIYFCFFLAAIHAAYAVYALQISDWSAVLVIAILQLGVAIVFAVLCGALFVSQGTGPTTRLLQLAISLKANAMLWSATIMFTSGLFSYVAWREAARWKSTIQAAL